MGDASTTDAIPTYCIGSVLSDFHLLTRPQVAEVHSEAVVRLQAAYRGFHTRTHKPEIVQGHKHAAPQAASTSPVSKPSVVEPAKAKVVQEAQRPRVSTSATHSTPHRPQEAELRTGQKASPEVPTARSPEAVAIRRGGEVVEATEQDACGEGKPREGRRPRRQRQEEEDVGRGKQEDAGIEMEAPQRVDPGPVRPLPLPPARQASGQEASGVLEGSAVRALPPRNSRASSSADAQVEEGERDKGRAGKGRRASVSAKEAMAVAMQGLMGGEEEEEEEVGGYSNDDFESEDGGA